MSQDIPDIFKKNFNNLSIKEMKDYLKSIYSTNSFTEKSRYIERLNTFKKVLDFPWRDDQRTVIDEFLKFDKKFYVIHAIFGSGKTTLLLGMMIYGILHRIIKPHELMFVSYNVSIRNEIKRRLKDYGVSSKITVRTFDSIIYEISKATDYPYINLPNFEGKRKHVYKLCFEDTNSFKMNYQPKLIFIDECQDLERQTLDILKYFYPDSRFVFAGDIFQSIQKEPRESILWHFMKELSLEKESIFRMYMSETPRVPRNVLSTLQSLT
jgi:superfamily I DNA and RNA helicase